MTQHTWTLAFLLIWAACLLAVACVVISRRWTGHLATYPVDWSPERRLRWERWRLALGLVLIASWVWGSFCLGSLVGSPDGPSASWLLILRNAFPALGAAFCFTAIWCNIALFDPGQAEVRMKVMRVAAVLTAILCFVSPLAAIMDL
jgi:hypothetical protein